MAFGPLSHLRMVKVEGLAMTEQYKVFEAALTGTDKGNPYTDIWLKAAFTNDSEKM